MDMSFAVDSESLLESHQFPVIVDSSIFPLKLKAGKQFVFGAQYQPNFKLSASVPLSLSAMCQFTACNEWLSIKVCTI
eukprot:m.351912 g.351912  ORF g.351912 m.351912 type:complete len:78 (+) comp16580_c1_seq1:118-351(+)